jgi:hypothetical protein
MAGASAAGDDPAPSGLGALLPPRPPPFAPVLSETVTFSRYLTVTDRTVLLHDATVSFDVVSHPQAGCHFCVVFPYHAQPEPAVTVIREFAQGPNALVWSLPAGGFDPAKHASVEDAGRAELGEEARMAGGAWTPLLPAGHPGLPEVKWCANRFTPLLCFGPTPVPPGAAPPRDAEECIAEVRTMPIREFMALLRSGEVLGPSFTTAWLALEELRERGEPV